MEEIASTRGIIERDIEELPKLRNKIRIDAEIAAEIARAFMEDVKDVNFGPMSNATIDKICAWYRFLYI